MRQMVSWIRTGGALLACVGTAVMAHAQGGVLLNENFRTYDSLTDLTKVGGTAETGTTDVTGDYPLTQRGSQKTSGAGAYSALFGSTFAQSGTGANSQQLLSTSIVLDDIYLRTAANTYGAERTSFSLDTFRLLLTNENTTSVNITANIRFYLDDGTRLISGAEQGGFGGTLLYSAQQDVTLSAGSVATPNVTQVEYDFSSAPLQFSNFGEVMNANYYEKRIWVGLFVTADNAIGNAALNNVGSVIYDTDLTTRNNSPFASDAPGGARSTDLIAGDDTGNISTNSPYNRNLYDYNASVGGKRQDMTGLANYRVAGGLNGTTDPDGNGPLLATGPDANLAYFFQGNVYAIPEPGTFGFVVASGLPLMGLVAARRRTRRAK